MATSVPHSTQNITSGVEKTAAAANGDSLRSSDNGASNTRFSDLLRGQMQVGIGTSNTLTAFSPAKTDTTPARENREPSRNNPPTRETRRDTPRETAADRSAPHAAKPEDNAQQSTPTPTENDAANPDAAQNIPDNPGTSPDLPATIAALLGGIAGHAASAQTGSAAETVPTEGGDAETDLSAQDDALTGHARHPATSARDTAPENLSAHAAATAKSNTPAHPALNAATFSQRADLLATGTGAQTAAAASSAQNANPLPLLNALRMPTQASAATPQFAVPTPVGQRGWAEEVGNRVMWMLGRAESRAELILTPPNLGKVEVSINLNGDQTTAQFIASSQAARDALEQAMPRLRELLAQAGISLNDASVNTSADNPTQDDSSARPGSHAANGQGAGGEGDHDDATAVTSATSANWVKTDNGLVNTFA